MSDFSNIGYKYKNFKVVNFQKIDEIKVNLIELVHEKTNAKVIKILNDDDENLFCFSFKTHPYNSNGIAHILEHTTLCGSKKFPIRDPFFMMLRRSLNTFMNAMTGSDFTCYPASSMLEKDYFNLMEVYLDAVFNPKLNRLDFLQEGHRLEFSDPKNSNSDLVFKGVVFNEMKGSMSNVDNRIFHKTIEKLMCDLPYSHNSGGDPKEIINLTHKELVAFHDKFYHPSRCIFFFYGNIDLKKELDFIEDNALKNIEKLPEIPSIKHQKRFSNVIDIEDKYPTSETKNLDEKSMMSIGYLTTPIDNQLDLYALLLIDNILMGTDGSFLKRALIESKLVKQVDSIIDTEISEIPYLLFLKGLNKKNKNLILDKIDQTLSDLISNDIPKELIDTALHQLEFSKTEISSDFGPYGLMLFFRSALLKQHNVDIKNSLVIHSLFNQLKEKFKNPNYIKDLIKKYFLDNKHKVIITFEADNNLFLNEEKEEKELLKKIKNKLTPEDKEKIIKDTIDLKNYQESIKNQSKDCLPKVNISDIKKSPKNYPLIHEKINNLNLYYHTTFTNDIIYADLIFDLPKLTKKEIEYLPFFVDILTQVGAKNRNYIDNLEYIQRYTGGFEADISVNTNTLDYNSFSPFLIIASKSLKRNASKMFEIFNDIIANAIFDDKERIKDILISNFVNLENSLPSNAMKYAIEESKKSLTKPSYFSSKIDSINYFLQLKEIVNDLDKNLDIFIENLKNLKEKVLLLKDASLVLSLSKDNLKYLKENSFFDIDELSKKDFEKYVFDSELKKDISSATIIPSSVSFNASSIKTIGYTHKDSPSLLIGSYLMKNNFLHKLIREMGGAYGSKCSYSPTNGTFTLSSYRDPHINSTLKAFKTSIEEVAKGSFTDEEFEEAKISIFQKLDAPISVGARAIFSYNLLKANQSLQLREKYRNDILNATKQDVIEAVKNHVLSQIDNMITSSFTSKELVEKEKINFVIKNL
jgi:hypothetical protein